MSVIFSHFEKMFNIDINTGIKVYKKSKGNIGIEFWSSIRSLNGNVLNPYVKHRVLRYCSLH